MNARHSWWIGRAWMIVGWWLVASGVIMCVGSGLRSVFSFGTLIVPGVQPFIVATLQGSLLVAGGLASIWAGRQRLARATDSPDAESIARLIAHALRGLKWGLGVIGALAAMLILAWPWINSTLAVQFIREASNVTSVDQIHHVRGGDAGWTAVLRGRLDAGRVDRFIAINSLIPDPAAENLRSMASSRQLQEWEKEWPDDPEWYSRRWQRTNDTCRMGCYVLCLVDRRSGGVWVAVEQPDFSGD